MDMISVQRDQSHVMFYQPTQKQKEEMSSPKSVHINKKRFYNSDEKYYLFLAY